MFLQKLDHELIEQPRLFNLACVARARQDFELAIGDAGLQGEAVLMGAVFAAG